MQAFHGSQDIKDKYLARVEARLNVQRFICKSLSTGAISVKAGKVFGRRGDWKTRNAAGYVIGTVHLDGVRQQLKAHQVIWINTHGIYHPRRIIDHINGRRSDNAPTNLRLVSHAENARNRRSYAGSQNPAAKINQSIADAIRLSHMRRRSYSGVAKEFGVSRTLVARIVRGELWA